MNLKLVIMALAVTISQSAFSQSAKSKAKKAKTSAYLFTYFAGNSKADEAIRFAYSTDGYNFKALNNNKAVISSDTISLTGGVRDPHILRTENGKSFYMVVTDMVSGKGWDSNRGMVLLKSDDLINWTSTAIDFQKRFPGNENLKRVWAPQTIYDAKKGKYMVYFSLKHGNEPDKLYYAYANKDFTDLETAPEQLFYSPNNSGCIDADIVLKDGTYHMFFKGETGKPGIKLAISKELTKGYELINEQVQQTNERVEGSGVFKLNDGKGYILMYDVYIKGKYQFTHSPDLKNFRVIDNDVSMDFHPRHGTVLPITAKELKRLKSKWSFESK